MRTGRWHIAGSVPGFSFFPVGWKTGQQQNLYGERYTASALKSSCFWREKEEGRVGRHQFPRDTRSWWGGDIVCFLGVLPSCFVPLLLALCPVPCGTSLELSRRFCPWSTNTKLPILAPEQKEGLRLPYMQGALQHCGPWAGSQHSPIEVTIAGQLEEAKRRF